MAEENPEKKEKPSKPKKAKKESEAVNEEETTTKETEDTQAVDALSEIDTLKTEVESLKDQLLRNQAELINFKRRNNEERIKDRVYANFEFIKSLLPALDTFETALDKEHENKALKPLLKGFEMIYRDIFNVLKASGLTPIEALNQPFDPNKHQAVMQEAKDGVAPNIIIEEFQKGYMYKDRLLRPSMVKVSA